MSWTATRLKDQSNTGRRIFLEPERREYVGPRLPYRFVPDEAEIEGRTYTLVKSERFRGNYPLTYRRKRSA